MEREEEICATLCHGRILPPRWVGWGFHPYSTRSESIRPYLFQEKSCIIWARERPRPACMRLPQG
jgi:hypothetical protein